MSTWVIISGEDVLFVEAEGPEDAFQSLPPESKADFVKRGYRIEPYPARMEVKDTELFTFEVEGDEGQDAYELEIHEYHNGVGFHYSPLVETAENLEKLAPVPVVQKLAETIKSIFRELELEPRFLCLHIQEPLGIGEDAGVVGRAVTDKHGRVCIKVAPVDFPLRDIEVWKGVLWHEALHAKYVLEGRWPSIWPFYRSDTLSSIRWLSPLECLQHLAIDGWLEMNGKPTPYYYIPDGLPDHASLKEVDLHALRESLLEASLVPPDERKLEGVASRLWGKETDIGECAEILGELGMEIPDTIPVGRYLRSRGLLP